jgi:hypothetical protein
MPNGLKFTVKVQGNRAAFSSFCFATVNKTKGPELPMVKLPNDQYQLTISWVDFFAMALSSNKVFELTFRIYTNKDKTAFYDFTNAISV